MRSSCHSVLTCIPSPVPITLHTHHMESSQAAYGVVVSSPHSVDSERLNNLPKATQLRVLFLLIDVKFRPQHKTHHFNHLRVYSSVTFSPFTWLCTCHLCLITECVHHPKGNPRTHQAATSCSFPVPGNHSAVICPCSSRKERGWEKARGQQQDKWPFCQGSMTLNIRPYYYDIRSMICLFIVKQTNKPKRQRTTQIKNQFPPKPIVLFLQFAVYFSSPRYTYVFS